MKARIEIVLDCSREHLWDFLEDPKKLALWVKGLVDFKLTSPPPHGAGSSYVMRMKEGGKINEYQGRNLAWDPPSHIRGIDWLGFS